MPIYCETLSIPANTSETNPVSLDIKHEQYLITKMEVAFPPGCSFMVKVKIQYGIHQEWPEKKGTWIVGDDETISWEERYRIPNLNEKLTIYGCSPNTTYPHNVVIRIMTLPLAYEFIENILIKLYKLWKRII